MAARPTDVRVPLQLEQQVQLLREQRVVVLQRQPEERERFGEAAASGHDLRATVREEVERGELLEHPHGVRRTEHGDGAREPDAFGAGRRCRQDDGRGGIQEFLAVVLADAEDIQPELVGQLDFFEQLAEAFGGAETFSRRGRVGNGEAI